MTTSPQVMETNNNTTMPESGYACQCGKNFKRRAPYERHLAVAHTDTEQHHCDHCGKTFGNSTTLTMHMSIHEKHKTFTQKPSSPCDPNNVNTSLTLSQTSLRSSHCEMTRSPLQGSTDLKSPKEQDLSPKECATESKHTSSDAEKSSLSLAVDHLVLTNPSTNLPSSEPQASVTIKKEPVSSDSEDGMPACLQPYPFELNQPDKLFEVSGSLPAAMLELGSEEEEMVYEELGDGKSQPLRKSLRNRVANPVWKSLLTGQVYEDVLGSLDGGHDTKCSRQEGVCEVRPREGMSPEVVKNENRENRHPDFLDLDQEQTNKNKKPRNRKPKSGGPLKPSHAEEGDGTSTFQCYVCGKKFLTEKYLSMHISLHGTVKSTEELLVSDSGQPSPTVQQEEEEAGAKTKKLCKKGGKVNIDGGWTCKICNKSFAHNSGYKNHMRTHSNERPYVCKLCDIGFKEKYHLKKHNLFIHSTELPEKCRFCGKRFKDSTAVRAHERIHSDARPFACRRCNKTFKTSECLWHHEHRSKSCGEALGDTVSKERMVKRRRRFNKSPSEDSKENPHMMEPVIVKKEMDAPEFDASLTGEMYEEPGYGAVPYRNCPEYPDYPEYCLNLDGDPEVDKEQAPKVIVVKQEELSQSCSAWEEDEDLEEALFAAQHPDLELIPGSQEFKCKLCKKNFLDLASFQKHSKIHTEERPFVCTKCDIGFKMKVHLKKHNLYVHSNEYPCECKFCGKRFKDSSAVKLHERTHSDIRPFQCTGCGKAFKTRENLWGHQHRGKCMASKVGMEENSSSQAQSQPLYPTAQASVYGNGVTAQAVVGNNHVTAQACVSNNQVTARAVIENNQITAHASFANNQVTAHASLLNNCVTAHATIVSNNQIAAQASVGNVKVENKFDSACKTSKPAVFSHSFPEEMKMPSFQSAHSIDPGTMSTTLPHPLRLTSDEKTYVNAKNNCGVSLSPGRQAANATPVISSLPCTSETTTTPCGASEESSGLGASLFGSAARWPTLKEFLSQGVDGLSPALSLPSSWCPPMDKQANMDRKSSGPNDCPTIKEHLMRASYNHPVNSAYNQQVAGQTEPQSGVSTGPIPSFQSTFLSKRRSPPPQPSSLHNSLMQGEDPASIPIIYWDDDQQETHPHNPWQADNDAMFHDISETVFTQL